jgi:hypothetical protein
MKQKQYRLEKIFGKILDPFEQFLQRTTAVPRCRNRFGMALFLRGETDSGRLNK